MAATIGPPLLDLCADMDAVWLTAVLRHSGHADAEVVAFDAKPIGAGNVSDTVRVRHDYARATTAPASVVCKFRCSNEIAHAHGIGSGSYFRELHSYRALMDRDDVCRIPKVYWIDGNPENINLVMEDLCDISRAGNQVAGCDRDDARSVVVELAKLHRGFYPMEASAAPDWGMTMAGTADYWSAAIDRAMPVIKAHVADRLTATELATIERAHQVAPAWYRLPMVRGALAHGDPRVDNILFKGTGDSAEAVLIDWQITGWRNPMHDVGYFLSGSVTIEDRREIETGLLDIYADLLAERRYVRADIDADYRVQLLSGLMTTVASYGLLTLTPDLDRLLMALLQRNAAAAADWDSLGAVRLVQA